MNFIYEINLPDENYQHFIREKVTLGLTPYRNRKNMTVVKEQLMESFYAVMHQYCKQYEKRF